MKKLLLLSAVSSLVLAGYAAGNLEHVVYDNVATDYITVVDDVNESTDQIVPENFSFAGKRLVARPNLTADDEALPGTFFQRPTGTFYCSLSSKNNYLINTRMYVPAFRNITYINRTTGASSHEWMYGSTRDGVYGDTLYSTVPNLTLWYDTYVTPAGVSLTANNAAGDSIYQIAPFNQAGGPAYVNTTSGAIFGAANYDYKNWTKSRKWHSGISGTNNPKINSRYTQQYKAEGVDTVYTTGCAELNEKPLSPYILQGVYAPLVIKQGGTLNLKIYKAIYDNEAKVWGLGELISETSTEVEASSNWVTVEFSGLQQEDPETGLFEENVVIDDATFTVIEAGSDGVEFYPGYYTHIQSIPNEFHAYNVVNFEVDGFKVQDVISANYTFTATDGSKSNNSSWAFGYNIINTFLYSETDSIDAPIEGISQDIVFNSYYNSVAWNDIKVLEAEDVPDWITVGEPINGANDNGNFNGIVTLPVTIAALPDDTRYREADITVSYRGAEFTVHVTQGTPPVVGVPGDVNNDLVVNAGDISEAYSVILGAVSDEETIRRADVNEDGSVNAGDISEIYTIILSASADGDVEIID